MLPHKPRRQWTISRELVTKLILNPRANRRGFIYCLNNRLCGIKNEEETKERKQPEIGSELRSPVFPINLPCTNFANNAWAIADGHDINLAGAILLRQMFASSDLPPKLKVTGFEVGSASVAVRHVLSLLLPNIDC